MIYFSDDRKSLLDPSHASLSIRRQCELLNINRSSLYYASKPDDADTLSLMRIVDEVYTKYPFFGTRQMVNYLRDLQPIGYEVGRTRMRSIYEKLGLRALCPGPHTSKPHPKHKVYPYLLRGVDVVANDQVWCADITYLRLRKGYVYLMAIMDWCSRYVLDWGLSISLEADFCIETLARALQSKRCEIFNTDQGSQFTSHGFTNLLIGNDVKISMDGKGRAFDNIFIERLWRSVKYEKMYLQEWDTVSEVRQALCEYFRFYNHERPHKRWSGKPPALAYLE